MIAEWVEIMVRLLESSKPMDDGGEFWKIKQMRLQVRSYEQPRMPLVKRHTRRPARLDHRHAERRDCADRTHAG
jgi:alkanesulfonate monooxygenase SsuD/methylene tetrahydromethanopterin reductase-like flavin-dependent oxidoreductase (luciferase family)